MTGVLLIGNGNLRPGRKSDVNKTNRLRTFGRAKAGQERAAKSNWPLLQFVQDLEGFDFAAFLVSAAVVFFSVGFAIDYIAGRQVMGPYWNSCYATAGAYAGLCAHDWWLRPMSAMSLT
jgi:hypothetical protein